jgi:hypothetical protein
MHSGRSFSLGNEMAVATTYGEEIAKFNTDQFDEILQVFQKEPPIEMILCKCGRRKNGRWILAKCGCPMYKLDSLCCHSCPSVPTLPDTLGKEKGHIDVSLDKTVAHDEHCESSCTDSNILESACCCSASELGESDETHILLIRTHKGGCPFRMECSSHTR